MSEQHEHKRDWFDEPCGGWRCDCGAWLGRDVKDPAGSAPRRAGTAPLWHHIEWYLCEKQKAGDAKARGLWERLCDYIDSSSGETNGGDVTRISGDGDVAMVATVIDPKSPKGERFIRNSAYEKPLTQGDPPPDDICSCDDPSLNVSTSDDPSGPAPAELLADLALPWRLDEQDQRDDGIYGYAVLDANGVCVADHCDLRRAQAIIAAVAQLATQQDTLKCDLCGLQHSASTYNGDGKVGWAECYYREQLATQRTEFQQLQETYRAQTDAHASTRIELATQQAALRELVEKWSSPFAPREVIECRDELARLLGDARTQ